ncbi:MAG: hypothetical protein KDA69_14890 [Planctomycetaceae bacterium]|nr:hypothetical protein [Planctomycetaceae bacterium]
MNLGNLQSSAGRLQEAVDVLMERWENTRDVWRDERARKLEEEYLMPLREQLAITLPAVGLMTQAIAAAQRDLNE